MPVIKISFPFKFCLYSYLLSFLFYSLPEIFTRHEKYDLSINIYREFAEDWVCVKKKKIYILSREKHFILLLIIIYDINR